MVQTITKNDLSGSTNGLQILVAATATAGTLIHTAVSGTTDFDEIWIFADNSFPSAVLLTIEYGGVSDPGNIIEVNIPALGTASTDGLRVIIPGLILRNSLVVRAFAGTTNVIKLSGWVNEIRA